MPRKINIILIYYLFLMGFFANSLVAYKIIPYYATLTSEIAIYCLFIISIFEKVKINKRFHLHLSWVWLLFLIVAICSIIINQYLNIRPLFSLRFVLRFYFLYLALINLKLDETELVRINKVLLFLFLIQLPVIAYKFSIYGVHERTIGTYAARGGGLTTMIPIIMVSYFLSYYMIYKRNKWYLLAVCCFVAWGIVGAKAALFFLFPITFFGLYILLVIKQRGLNYIRDLSMLGCIGVLSIAVMAAFLAIQPRLNQQREVGGKIDFKYALQFAENYSNHMRPNDPRYGGGRSATTKLAFKQLLEDGFENFVFGYGPGSMTPSVLSIGGGFDSRVKIIAGSYGITGMVYIWIEYGLFGVLLFCLLFGIFFRENWQWYNQEINPYWKAFSAGSIVFCLLNLFTFITYNKIPISDDTLMPIFYYAMAVMHIRYLQLGKKIHSKKYCSGIITCRA